MLRATNIERAKLINLWVVFDAVRLHGPLSRAEIARRTGLSKQTVSNLADELYEAGLLRPEAKQIRGVGKPSIPLAIDPSGGLTVGLQLDRGRLVSVLADLSGQVLRREVRPFETRAPEAAVPLLEGQVARLLDDPSLDRRRLLGIGLVMPGPFDVEGLGPTSLPGWDGLAIAADLGRAIGQPVILENDATAAASAEWLFGAARTLDSFVYVFLGIGLGAGLIVGGRPIASAAGNAGEFGHLIVAPGGRPCDCGNRGCLEAYLSLHAAFRHLAARGVAIGSIEAMETRLSPDHPAIAEWIAEVLEPLRIGLNALENLLDPETILLGGDAPDWLIRALVERVEPLYPSIGRAARRRAPRLMRATLGRDAAARGAAVLPIFAALDPGFRPLGPRPDEDLRTERRIAAAAS